jgi:hypothetical protein
MNCKPLQALSSHELTLKGIKPLQSLSKQPQGDKYLSNIEALLYNANILYYVHRLLNNEILVRDRDRVLNDASKEMAKIQKRLSEEYTANNAITTKERKEVFKRLKITPERLSTDRN